MASPRVQTFLSECRVCVQMVKLTGKSDVEEVKELKEAKEGKSGDSGAFSVCAGPLLVGVCVCRSRSLIDVAALLCAESKDSAEVRRSCVKSFSPRLQLR
jgi:hypothetical protein